MNSGQQWNALNFPAQLVALSQATAGRGRAPKPVAKLHGLTLWDSKTIHEWVEDRKKGIFVPQGEAQ